jgi:hypothetical protein
MTTLAPCCLSRVAGKRTIFSGIPFGSRRTYLRRSIDIS